MVFNQAPNRSLGVSYMGRRRTAGVNLPEGVQFVREPSGRIYYYYTPGRNTKAAGQRVSLGSDPYDPQFWRRLRDARGRDAVAALTFDALIEAYKASPEWEHHRPTTRRDYALYSRSFRLRPATAWSAS